MKKILLMLGLLGSLSISQMAHAEIFCTDKVISIHLDPYEYLGDGTIRVTLEQGGQKFDAALSKSKTQLSDAQAIVDFLINRPPLNPLTICYKPPVIEVPEFKHYGPYRIISVRTRFERRN